MKIKRIYFKNRSAAFTVLELLIVIIIIGILSTLVFLSWYGIKDKTIITAISSELNSASKTLSLYNAEFGSYPESNDCSNGNRPEPPKTCLTFGNGIVYDYAPQAPDYQSYILIASKGDISLQITNNTPPTKITLPETEKPSVPIASSDTVGNITTFTWSGSTCPAGILSYQYRLTINNGYDSGYIPTTNTSFSTSTINEGYTFTLTVQSKCSVALKESDWSDSATDSYYRPITTPASPTVAAIFTSPNIVTTVNAVTCVAGNTPQYNIRVRTDDGAWGAYSAWGTTTVFSQAAVQGVKYGFQSQARCHNDVSDSSYATSTESTYIHPLTNSPIGSPIASSTTSGLTTTFSWTAVTCSAGVVGYQYRYVTSGGYDSGWVATTATSFTATTSVENQTYTLNVQARCATAYSSGPWTAISATSYTRPASTTYYTLTNSAGTGGTVSSGGTYASGTNVTITASANSGYTFSSWSGSTGCNGTASHSITVDSNKSCTANFTASSVYYSLTANAGTGGSASGSVGSVLAGTSRTITATPNSGYSFSSWSGSGCSGTASHNVTVNSNMTCTANFTADPPPTTYYTLTNSAGTGGTVSTGGTYASGTSVTITASANSGYTFTSWSGSTGCSGTASHSITVDSNKSCTANFTASSVYYSLTVNAGTGGTASGSVGSVLAGTSRTITATPNSGYSFSSWSGTGCSGTASHNVIVNSNMTCTANFTKDIAAPSTPNVTLSVSGQNLTFNWVSSCAAGTTVRYQVNSIKYNPSTTQSGYLMVGQTSQSGWMDMGTTTSTTFVAHSAFSGVVETIQAQARCTDGTSFSSWSATGSAAYDNPIPAPAAPTVNVSLSGSTLTYSWASSCVSSGGTNIGYRVNNIKNNPTAGMIGSYSPGITQSGWLDVGTQASSSFNTGGAGLIETVQVQARCGHYGIYSPWSSTGSATYTNPTSTYNLTVTAGTGGTATGGGTGITAGTPRTITAAANSGYTFSSWTGGTGCAGAASHSITVNSSVTCTANFTANPATYTLTVTAGTGGTATGGGTGITAGTPRTITATANAGYSFSSWSGTGCSGLYSHSVIVNSNMTCTANFIVTYTLLVSAGTGGTATGSIGGVPAGTSRTITATPNATYKFGSWTGTAGCAGTASHSVTVNSSMSCTANFLKI